MKIRTSELSGAALDYTVALAEGEVRELNDFYLRLAGKFAYSIGPAGDDIIDREKIDTMWDATGQWKACITPDENEPHYFVRAYGPTRRIAAMRCWAAHKLGAEIEIPEELVKPPETKSSMLRAGAEQASMAVVDSKLETVDPAEFKGEPDAVADEANTIYARVERVYCPYCDAESEGWFGDPRGVETTCDDCKRKFKVAENAEVKLV